MGELFRRLSALLRREAIDRDVDEELQFHLEMKARETGDARTAEREVGPALLWRERARDAWGWRWLDELAWDLRYACRVLLRRDRAFAAAAIATLTLAIGLNVFTFAVMDTELFRGFPLVKRNDQIVAIQEVARSGIRGAPYADFAVWAAQSRAFQGMALVLSGDRVSFSAGGRPTDIVTFEITANTFGLLGVPPLLGRDFVAADESAGAPRVLILNYRFWARRFGKRPDIVGTTVSIDGAPATIVGVMPERFEFPHQTDFWLPATHAAEVAPAGTGKGGYFAFGRLRPDLTIDEARTDLETITRRLEAAFPATHRGARVSVRDTTQFHAGPNGRVIYGTLWAGACFVLLIACANVSNLTLVRTVGRWRELSTRMALGAGRGRLLRQILLEDVVLVSAAAAIAWRLARSAFDIWAARTASAYQILDYTIDSRTVWYIVAVSVVTAAICSVGPMLQVAQLGRDAGLTACGRGVTQAPRGRRLAPVLVAVQMALAIVLLGGAGVLVRSFSNIVNADTGVRDPSGVLTGTVRLPSDTYPTGKQQLEYLDRLEAALATVPGVESRAVADVLPVGGGPMRPIEVEGRPSVAAGQPTVQFISIGPGYFRVLGAPLMAGRDFTRQDAATTPPVALVNQSFADRFGHGEPMLGRRLRRTDRSGEAWWTVVGIAPNIMEGDAIRQEFKPVVYVPFRQEPLPRVYFLARTAVPPDQVARSLRLAAEGADRDVSLEKFGTLEATFAFDGDYMDLAHMELGKDAAVSPMFALIALLLAGIGLYAIIAHSVSQRTQEIGVRMAIGAETRHIRRLVFGEGLLPVACGIALGLASSLAVNRVLESQLVGVSPYDLETMVGALAALSAVALLACHVPARRATRVDPVVALRHE